MDKTTQMTVFVRAVDAGSFSAAGRALQMTPSAVSKQVSRLDVAMNDGVPSVELPQAMSQPAHQAKCLGSARSRLAAFANIF